MVYTHILPTPGPPYSQIFVQSPKKFVENILHILLLVVCSSYKRLFMRGDVSTEDFKGSR